MKEQKRKLNVRLLRRIKRHILSQPRRLYMNWFITTLPPGEKFVSDNGKYQAMPACGTAACIAGWANLLTDGKEADDWQRASKLIGLEPTVDGSYHVFDVPSWPEPFQSQYKSRKTARGRATIAANRIEHLIAKGE